MSFHSHQRKDCRRDISRRRQPALHKRLVAANKQMSRAQKLGIYSEERALAVLQSLLEAKQLPVAIRQPCITKPNSWKDRK